MARFFIVLLLLTVGSTNAEVRLQSAIDISKLLTAEDKVREAYGHRTFEIAFSRDEKLVAIAVGSHETVVGLRTHILVLGVAAGKTKFQKDLPGTYVSKLDWSSDDRKLLVQSGDGSWIFDLEGGGEDCHTGELGGGGFVGPDSFAIVDHTSGDSAVLSFFDMHCNRIDEVPIPGRVREANTSDQIIVLPGDDYYGDIRILRGPTWKTFSTIVTQGKMLGLSAKILNGGKTVCAGRLQIPRSGDNTLECWELDEATPRLVSRWPADKMATEVVGAAIRSTLAVLLESERHQPTLFAPKFRIKLKRWVIWDAKRGAIVGELPAKHQAVRYGSKNIEDPWASAMSPSGNMLAVGGDGKLEIYTIEHAQ